MPRDAIFQLRDMFQPPDQGNDSDSDIDEQVILNKIYLLIEIHNICPLPGILLAMYINYFINSHCRYYFYYLHHT